MSQTIINTDNYLYIVALATLVGFPHESCKLVANATIEAGKVTFKMKTGLEQSYKIGHSTVKIRQEAQEPIAKQLLLING